ncbi:MAG: DNA-processing protein DprA [Lachnospiraceae bacterium]|nr:DNA-processing protein DprA [Lachnospiraceae bacterium]
MTENQKELEQRIYAAWLDTIYWVASETKYRLLGAAGTMQKIYAMEEGQLAALMGLQGCERFLQHRNRYTPQKVWNYLTEIGVSYTYCQAVDFPRKLAEIPDPPFGIFYKGRLPDEKIPAVAIIGARKCSEYGRLMAEKFAKGFAERGVDVISGMAVGIDGISQAAALKAGGSSYAVLGCGVDIVYPRSNEPLYRQILENGGVLSEYPPQMDPRPALFPPRNRIISALADVVLVVEAREKSGTLITVDMALEQGREVYTIPGRCTDSLSMGCNRLIRRGAAVAVTPEDIIDDMFWETMLKKPKNQPQAQLSGKLSQAAQEVYAVLEMLPITQEAIVAKLREKNSTCTIPQICQGLVELELKGFILCRNRQYGRLRDELQ